MLQLVITIKVLHGRSDCEWQTRPDTKTKPQDSQAHRSGGKADRPQGLWSRNRSLAPGKGAQTDAVAHPHSYPMSPDDRDNRNVKRAAHLHLVPRLRLRGAISPFSFMIFMAWRSFKHGDIKFPLLQYTTLHGGWIFPYTPPGSQEISFPYHVHKTRYCFRPWARWVQFTTLHHISLLILIFFPPIYSYV